VAEPRPAAVYLDHNATAPVRNGVVAAMVEALQACGNPSSVHGAGRAARARVDRARRDIALALGLPADALLVFTSGGTEANHLALKGTGASRVLISALEHDSVCAAVPGAEIIPALPDGTIDLAALETLLKAGSEPTLVSVMAANNETGVLQPLAEIARLAHEAGALVHSDAVQAVGRVPLDPMALGIDLVTVSAHKLGGPLGVGALAIRPGLDMRAIQTGGGQERGLRSGTENVPGIAGFAVAVTEAIREQSRWPDVAALRDGIAQRLGAVEPDAVVFGAEASRLPNTLCIAMPGVPAETQVMALDLAGIAVSAGSACSSGKVKASHVLAAMGVPADLARSAIRISLGLSSTAADADRLVAAWTDLRRRTKGKAI
jgi:cysteine desulfurase